MSLTVTNGKSINRISSLPYSTLKLRDTVHPYGSRFLVFNKSSVSLCVINYGACDIMRSDEMFYGDVYPGIKYLGFRRSDSEHTRTSKDTITRIKISWDCLRKCKILV